MRYVRLKDEWAKRGWYGLPWALTNVKSGDTGFLDKMSFSVLEFCNGEFDVDLPLFFPKFKEKIEEGLKLGIIQECEKGEGLKPYQEYKKYNTRYVRTLQWSITGKCNLLCKHCYLSAPEAQYGELSTEDCLRIVEQIAEAGIYQVAITGGEPLVREDFWVIIDALMEKGICVKQLYTNGILVDDEFISQSKKREMQWEFVLSHDGVGCHDWMRGLVGTEKVTVETMKRIKEAGYYLFIETALHKDNLGSFRDTYQLMKELGVDSWKSSPVMDTGNWRQETDKKEIQVGVLYDTYLNIIKEYRGDSMPLTLMLGGIFFNRKGNEKYSIPFDRFSGDESAKRQTMCGSCRTHLYMLPNGKIIPCIPMTGSPLEMEMPNALEKTISEIMMDSTLFNTVNTRLEEILKNNEECAQCEYALRCGAGCKACALNEEGTIFGKDSAACYFWKQGYEAKVNLAAKGS